MLCFVMKQKSEFNIVSSIKTMPKKRKLCGKTASEESNRENSWNSEESDVEFEKEFEKRPRRSCVSQEPGMFLPLKGKNVVFFSDVSPGTELQKSLPKIEYDEEKKVSSEGDHIEGLGGSRNFIDHFAKEQKYLMELKNKIGILSITVVENPEKNMQALKTLIAMLHKPCSSLIISETKLIALSLLHIFNDILPGYKIRSLGDEEQKKLKKKTKELVNFETSLLRNYKKYLDCLHQMICNMKPRKTEKFVSAAKRKVLLEIGLVALKCMCDLLVTRPNFNYFKNILNVVVPLGTHGNALIADRSCDAMVKLFKADRLGEASLEIVKQICKVLKERKFCVSSKLLLTFLALNVKEAKVVQDKKKDMKKIRKQMNTMSRKEKQRSKKMRALEQQLREVEAQESQESKSKFHTEILQKIFWVYFHVIKDRTKTLLLSPVLEGLATFAHLINLEYFDDLSSVLCGLLDDGDLKDVEKLHCMQTMFIILSGHAESLSIDPQALYCHLYKILLNLQINTSHETFLLALKCLDLMIIKRKKKVSTNRVFAFVKRLCTVALQTPLAYTMSLLCMVKHIISSCKNCDLLLDTEASIGSGIYLPELDDPEYCNAHSTSLWELQMLQHHYNPVVSAYANHLLYGCPFQGRFCLSDELSKLSPEETFNFFSLKDNIAMPKGNVKHKDKVKDFTFSFEFPSDATLQWSDVQKINF